MDRLSTLAKALANDPLLTKKFELQIALKETDLKPLFEMVNVLYKFDCLPESKVAYVEETSRDHKAVGKEIDLKGTLLNLKNFTVSDLIGIYKKFVFRMYGEPSWRLEKAFKLFKTFISKFPIADIEQIDDKDIKKLQITLNRYGIGIKLNENDDGNKAFWDFAKSINEEPVIVYSIAEKLRFTDKDYSEYAYYDYGDKFLAKVVSSIKESKQE